MAPFFLPFLFTVFVWWFSTGVILYLVGLPRRTHKWTMAGASLLLVAALCAVARSASDPGHAAAYVGFTAALAVWACTLAATGSAVRPSAAANSGSRTKLRVRASLMGDLLKG